MRRAVMAAICLIVCILLSSCSEIVSREAVGSRYEPEYNELIIEYIHYSDPDDGEVCDIRKEYMLHHAAVYEIQYRIVYRSGNVAAVWEAATQEEYRRFNNSRETQ